MQTNNVFSFQRFIMLFKQSLIINKKIIGISMAAVSGGLFGGLILLQSMNNFRNWAVRENMTTFWILFFILGIIYLSLSFPAFRSKDKTMAYLMLPASSFEKYIFELLTRIVAFIIIMPTIFWAVVNIETTVVHYIIPEFLNNKFSFNLAFSTFNNPNNHIQNGWLIFAVVQGFLFAFIIVFCGASHFSKSPLIKTLFTISLIIGGYSLYSYLLAKGLRIEEYNVPKSILFKDKQEAAKYFTIIVSIVNLSILALAWFRLKEKEA